MKSIRYIVSLVLIFILSLILINVVTLSIPETNLELKTDSVQIKDSQKNESLLVIKQEKNNQERKQKQITPEPTQNFSENIQVPVTIKQRESISIKLAELEPEITMLAKLVYTEARSHKIPPYEKASVIWCVFNRVDNERWPDTIKATITQKNQFAWNSSAPVWEELYILSKDVTTRWFLEKEGFSNVGRVLPKDYFFFASDKKGHNRFRQEYKSKTHWDWSLKSPYLESNKENINE